MSDQPTGSGRVEPMKNRWRLRVIRHLLADQPRSLGDGDPPSEREHDELPNARRHATSVRVGTHLPLGRW